MPLKISVTGDPLQAKALINLLQGSGVCTDLKAHAPHYRRDGDVTQTLLLELTPARHYQTRPERKVRDKSGWCYVLRTNDADRLYKLGCSKDPASRRATFKTNFPVKNDYEVLIETDDMFALERELHRLFAAKRVKGTEFFSLDETDLNKLRGMAA